MGRREVEAVDQGVPNSKSTMQLLLGETTGTVVWASRLVMPLSGIGVVFYENSIHSEIPSREPRPKTPKDSS